MTKIVNTNEFEFKAEMKQLLNIIVHSLYTNHEIFLRELVSNSSDALNKLRFRRLTDNNLIDPEVELNIKISVDKENHTFSIEDSGIGMTKDDLINKIGTVASSGTLEFLKNIKEKKETLSGELIGQFGVGFYSAFMVTDEITIETLYAEQGSKAFKWISKGEEKYTIEESDKTTRGTKISFKFKEEHKELAEDYTIKSILEKYSNFIDFPIFVNNEEVNKVKPLWQRSKDDLKEEEINEFYKFLSNDYEEPLGYLHFSVEGNINFKALVFIQKTAPPSMFTDLMNRTLSLYSSRIFIQDDCKELLPDYMRFLRGVIDTDELPLNISREVTQSSPIITKIRNIVTGKVLTFLEDWAQNDKEKYDNFYKSWGSLFKTGLNSDFANKERLTELVRYETSDLDKGKMKSLKEYVASMQEGQKDIFYLMGDSRELIERNPNLEYFKKKGIEVIYLWDPVDVFTFPYISIYDGKTIKSIDKADLDITKDVELESNSLKDNESKTLITFFKETLGDKVEDVIESKRLIESPVTLVVSSKGVDPQMEKMMKYFDKEFSSPKKILEINTSHKLIKNLYKLFNEDKSNDLLALYVNQLFDGALLIEGMLNSPSEYVQRTIEVMTKASE